MTTRPEKYVYEAYVIRVIDGDTLVVDIDLGLRVWARGQHVRLLGINMPERVTTLGILATSQLGDLVYARTVLLRTVKDRDDKYGRLLATVWVGETNVNETMRRWLDERRGQ
jgi:micrococcal nuclease